MTLRRRVGALVTGAVLAVSATAQVSPTAPPPSSWPAPATTLSPPGGSQGSLTSPAGLPPMLPPPSPAASPGTLPVPGMAPARPPGAAAAPSLPGLSRTPGGAPPSALPNPPAALAPAGIVGTPAHVTPATNPGAMPGKIGPLDAAVTPKAVNFGALAAGDSREQPVVVTVPRDGEFTVALAPGMPFRIVKVEVLSDNPPAAPRERPAPPTPMNPPAPARGVLAPAPLSGAPVSLGVPPPGPGVASTLPALAGHRSVVASATSAPFRLPARFGDEIVVTVGFTPDPNPFTGPSAGRYNASLKVEGPIWNATVPVTGEYTGQRLGTILTIQEKMRYVVDAQSRIEVAVTLTGAGTAHTGQLRVAAGTPGVRGTSRATVAVPAAGSVTPAPLILELLWNGGLTADAVPRQVPIEFAYEGGVVRTNLELTPLPSAVTVSRTWTDCEVKRAFATLTLHTKDGDSPATGSMMTQATNSDVLSQHDLYFDSPTQSFSCADQVLVAAQSANLIKDRLEQNTTSCGATASGYAAIAKLKVDGHGEEALRCRKTKCLGSPEACAWVKE